jgi:hypothetical protein
VRADSAGRAAFTLGWLALVAHATLAFDLRHGVGPLLLARCVAATGSYASAFYVLAAIVAVLGIAAAAVPLPLIRR